MFSPYYAFARRKGTADPLNHAALNVALYGEDGRWSMTERGRASVARSTDGLAIGPSALTFDGTTLTFSIDELAVPIPRRVRGRIRVHPETCTRHVVDLDEQGRHRWWPFAPRARVEVALEHPALRWSGDAYLDTNRGDEPLEAAFHDWTWSRAGLGRDTVILYDMRRRAGGDLSLAFRIDPSGEVLPLAAPPKASLARCRWWRMPRQTRADAGRAELIQTLEDTPFYARSVLRTRLLGEEAIAVHESLSLDRFKMPWVQTLLPFRMPRIPRPWGGKACSRPQSKS